MNDEALADFARAAGVETVWTDVWGRQRNVGAETLRSVLAALGLPAGSDAEIAESREALAVDGARMPALLTAEAGASVAVPQPPARYELRLADGSRLQGEATAAAGGAELPAVSLPGYHVLHYGDARTTLAVAPPRAWTAREASRGRALWGIAVQLYALRRSGDAGIGDYEALAQFAGAAARAGADAILVSPVHAQFTADFTRFSPYAPSNRGAYNAMHVPVDFGHRGDAFWQKESARLENLPLVEWEAASAARIARLRSLFGHAIADADQLAALADFREARGAPLEQHALFEALHAHLHDLYPERWHWREWPAAYRDPESPEVWRFAREHARSVTFHAWLQFLADRALNRAQRTARDAGMAIGLISDLAVGTDSGGSFCWSRQDETLLGLSVGAPPDLYQANGQSWGLAGFNPRALRAQGYRAFLDMLRAALRHAGGARIDHAMGLNRLWVVPEGAPASDGAYLSYPETDLRRLIRLESFLHQAVVVAEDLGTVPEGFSERLAADGIAGMRVLWFERNGDRFRPPARWSPSALAMTTTHDLPTVAGWWSGADLAWRERLGTGGGAEDQAARAGERAALWDAFRESGAVPAGEAAPPPAEPSPAVDAALRHVGRAACDLAIIPIEDFLGERDQPNLPGTTDQHPNWRRRHPAKATAVLGGPETAARIRALADARAERGTDPAR